jgi:hypothetical protein
MRNLFSGILLLFSGFAFGQVAGHVSVYWPESNVYMNSVDMIAVGNNGVLDLRSAFPATANFALCRVDSSGNPLWYQKVICTDTSVSIYPQQLVSLPADGFLVSGKAENSSANPNGFFAMRFDSAANLIWKKIYFPGGNGSPQGVVTLYDPANSQRIYFAWQSDQQVSPYNRGITIFKTDLNGDILDTAFFSLQNAGVEYPVGTINTAGNLVFAGGGISNLGFVIVDTTLQVIEANSISGSYNGLMLKAISEAAPGKYLIAGTDGNYGDLWLRLDSIGQLEYQTRIIPYQPSQHIEAIERTSSGDVYAIMHSEASIVQYTNTTMAHFNDTGGVVEVYSYRGGGVRAFAIRNDLPILALQQSGGNWIYPTAYIQTDSTGQAYCNSNISYIQYYQPTVSLTQLTPAVTYVPVSTPVIHLFSDSTIHTTIFTTIDFCLLNAIEEQQSTPLNIWPVPAHDVLYVENSDANSTYVVYDINGKIVLGASISNAGICLENLTPGYYFLEVNDGNHLTRTPFIKE